MNIRLRSEFTRIAQELGLLPHQSGYEVASGGGNLLITLTDHMLKLEVSVGAALTFSTRYDIEDK